MQRLDDTGRNTWDSKAKSALFQYGYGYAWVANEIGNPVLMLHLKKNCCLQNTFAFIENSPKALCHKMFKSVLEAEKMLLYIYALKTSEFSMFKS